MKKTMVGARMMAQLVMWLLQKHGTEFTPQDLCKSDLCGASVMGKGQRQAASCLENKVERLRKTPDMRHLASTCAHGHADTHTPETHSRNMVKLKVWLHSAVTNDETKN